MKTRCLSLIAVVVSLTTVHAGSGRADDKTDAKKPKVTYDENVRPILREHCFTCHNQNQSKGGLALDSFGRLMEGGSSGEVVFEGDLDSSRLWSLVSHEEEPYMPPNQDPLPKEKLDVLRAWIDGGLLENSGSKAGAKKKTLDLAVAVTSGKPEGPPPMPGPLTTEPVVYTTRPAAISALAASPWAPLAAVAGQKQIALYQTDSAELLGILPFPEGIPYCLQFSRDGALLLAGGGRGASLGLAALYDVKTGRRLQTVGDELDVVLASDLSNDHQQIALGGPQRIVRLFLTATGELQHEIRKHTDWVLAVRFSPDGVLLATSDRSNGLFVWEADTAREYLNLRGHTGAVTGVAWRPDSNVLASASLDGTVRLWEMNDGKQIKRWNAHGGGVNSVTYTQDGRLITSGRDRTAKLWDGNGKLLKTFPAFSEPALHAVVTTDGKRAIAGDWTGAVRVWTIGDGKQVSSLPANPPTVTMRLADVAKQLQDSQAQHKQQLLAWEAAKKSAQAVADKNAAALAAAQKRTQQAATNVKQRTQKLATLKSQVAEAQNVVRLAQAELQKAQKAPLQKDADPAASKQRITLATQAVDQAKKKLEQLNQALDSTAKSLPAARQAATKAAADAKSLPAKLSPAKSQADKVTAEKKSRLDALQSELEAIKKRHGRLLAEDADLKKK